jgi:error-prone DNA polymerase
LNPPPSTSSALPDYAELHCVSNFTFLRGASHPEELVARVVVHGYAALALTDECSLAGVVRAHLALRALAEQGPVPKLLIGSEMTTGDGMRLVFLAQNREGYGNLSALITLARRRAGKGAYSLQRHDLNAVSPNGAVPDCLVLWVPGEAASVEDGCWLAGRFPGRCRIAVELHAGPDDAAKLADLRELGAACGLPLVAAGDVHMHERARRPVQDVLTALRLKTSVFDAGHALFPNGERHLRSRLRLSRLYPPELLAETLAVAGLCTFSLDELRYEYPEEIVPAGHTPASWLRHETEAGLRRRYPQGEPAEVRGRIEHELKLIAEMRYEAYFLTVYDIVCFARGAGILCQGRGSAANSTVCFALGITEVDPGRAGMLFERFVSKERGEPPDIDVDFEHERRDEVIAYIYGKYGRERTALAAAVITYRTKGALRDAGRVLGFDIARIDALTASLAWWDKREQMPERFAEQGLDPASPRVAKWLWLAEQLRGFPRHLTQHVGGFVMSRGPLARLVPVENTAMPERTVIQWDKDDLDAVGLMKVDVLALGMLSALRRMLALIGKSRDHENKGWPQGQPLKLSEIPEGDAATYDMLCRADSMGVFQVESRAQMSMLPRLKPRNYYDLVIEVSLVRPGPIQGDMVHPYLKRRQGKEKIERIDPAIDAVLARTCGVPIFQEQVMQLAIVAAGFTPGEADQLRRAMAAWRRKGDLARYQDKLRAGMAAKGVPGEFIERIVQQIQGFGDYGFPESHAASFALLVYASAWIKRHYPAIFLCGLLNSQPMGFYSPSMLIQDARRHGVSVLPVDVNASDWDSRIDESGAVRLGLREIKGLGAEIGAKIGVDRRILPFASVADLVARVGLSRRDMDVLAAADALRSLAGHRRQAAWAASIERAPSPRQGDLFSGQAPVETPTALPAPKEGEELVADYRQLGHSLRRHPLTLLREYLAQHRFQTAADLRASGDRASARIAGVVVGRQRPGTATGIVFVTLEDETGWTNVVVQPWLVEKQRHELLAAPLLGVYGQLQQVDGVSHVVAKRLVDLSAWLGRLETSSRDFH